MKKKLPLGFELFSRRIPEPFNNIYIYISPRQPTPLGRFRGRRAALSGDQTKIEVADRCVVMSVSEAGPQESANA